MPIRALLLTLTLALAFSCTGPSAKSSKPSAPALRVGTTRDTPPYASRRGDRLEGLEVDLAVELGNALGRPVRFSALPFNELLDALLDDKVDVVMAGVTVTPARAVRIAFGTPYLNAGMGVLIRREDAKRFAARDAACQSPIDVGIVSGTEGERQLTERCPKMVPRVYPSAPAAVGELRERRIDAVVHDVPVLQWMQSRFEGELQLLPARVGEQSLAWAFRPDDPLREQANQALETMRGNGTLDRILDRWVPGARGSRAQ
jgi:polar amino acid transport system substrate-binding protein